MTVTLHPQRLFTDRPETYTPFIRLMRYPQGLRAFFLASPLLQSNLRVVDAGCGTGVSVEIVRCRRLLRRRGRGR